MTGPNVCPPNPPWTPLADNGSGYLSVYLNDPLARWPVREVTKPADNKSDPNIETSTYGLFSTCEPSMRKAIVSNGAATIFFMTSRDKVRWLTGYYHIGWSAPGVRGASRGDYALAADAIKFVDPIDPKSLAKPARTALLVRFRTQKPIGMEIVQQLRKEIDGRTDRTEDYLAEVKRLEQFSLEHSGFAYPSWGRETGFSWDDEYGSSSPPWPKHRRTCPAVTMPVLWMHRTAARRDAGVARAVTASWRTRRYSSDARPAARRAPSHRTWTLTDAQGVLVLSAS